LSDFDWDDANQAHIAAHGVTPSEAEEVLEGDLLELGPQIVNGEERFPAVGMTRSGRWLVVIVTQRGALARVVTAFEADKNLIALYLRNKWGTL
jgi:hypothetical protein